MNIFKKIIFLLLWGGFLYSQTVFVPSHYRVYDFLERMETKGLLRGFHNDTRPLSRLEIAKGLRKVYEHSYQLGQTEAKELGYYISLFREELGDLYKPHAERLDMITKHKWIDGWLPDKVYANGRNLFSYSDDITRINIDPILSEKRLFASVDTLQSTEKVFEQSSGFLIWGTLGDHVGYYTDVRDTREWGTRNYPLFINTSAYGLGFVSGGNGDIYHDETRAYLVYNKNWFLLQFGKDENQWGPGYRGQLALSDNATSYDFLKIQVNTRPFKLTSMYAVLKHFTPEYYYGNHLEKYMAAHRIEFSPFSWLNVGMHEIMIFSERKFEAAYVNPVMFFRSAEHYLGDRDNAAMGMDVELFVLPRTKIYAELFLDDVTTSKLGSSFYGNKYAYLAGIYHVNPLGLANTDIRLEYSRLRPFVYSHKSDINTYNHFVTGMGHWSGPNSDDIYIEMNYRPTFRTRFTGFVEKKRHGSNTEQINAGGDIFTPHDPSDSVTAPFLDGILEENLQFGILYRYELFYNCYLTTQYSYGKGDSELYPDTDLPGKRSEFWFHFSLNY